AAIQQRLSHVIVLDAMFELLDATCVVMNNALGATQAALHLIQSGHVKIGYVASTTRIPNFDDRRAAFTAALDAHGLSIDPNHNYAAPPSVEGAEREFSRLLAEGNRLPTALFC